MKAQPIKTILVVDDEPVLREILREILEEGEFQVVEAEGGHKAFEILQKQKIDCMITDVRMPLGNGLELLRQVLSLKGGKPRIILMTAYGDIGWEEAKKLNVSKIISKPFEPASILSEVRGVLSGSY